MSITPEHTIGEPQKPRFFIDREEPVAIFTQALDLLPLSDNKVINYHGIGGIGKSELRKELCNLLNERHDSIIWVSLDFSVAVFRDMENALFSLRRDLHRNYKVQFHSFDIAYACYWQLVHPQTTLNKEKPFFLEESSIIADVVSIIGGVPFIQWAPKVIEYSSKGYSKFKEWWTKRGVAELQRLQSMEPKEIIEWLPAFFGHDISDHLEDKRSRMVLFLDSYETLWTQSSAEGQFFLRDKWVRELASHLPSVLWILSGREKLRWNETDTRWEGHIEPYLLGDLSDNDADSFLVSSGIGETDVRNTIIQVSKGVPFYLDLQVDTYREIKEAQKKTPSPGDFATIPGKVIDNFTRHLSDSSISENETIKLLAFPRFWNFGIFKFIVELFKTGYPQTALLHLCRFSFVQETQFPDSWKLHDLMREGLTQGIEQNDKELFQRVHKALFDYYCQFLQDLEPQNINETHKTSLVEAFYHGQRTSNFDEFHNWFRKIYEEFHQAAMWQFLTPLLEEFTDLTETTNGLEHPDTATNLNKLAMLYRDQGFYEQAEPLHKRALEIREKVRPEHPLTATYLDDLAGLYHDQGLYEQAEPLYKRALEIREKVLGPEHPLTIQSLILLTDYPIE